MNTQNELPVNEATIRRLLESVEISISEKEEIIQQLPTATEGDLLKLLQNLSRKALGSNKLQHKTQTFLSKK